MSVAAPEAPAIAPAVQDAPPVPIPEVSSAPAGAQAIQPAPQGTIPAPIKPYSESPNSAKSKMLERLKNAGKKPATEAKPAESAKPAEPAKPAETPAAAKPEGEVSAPETDDDEDLLGDGKPSGNSPKEPTTPSTTTPETKEKKGVNPWKLADEHKQARAVLEKEVVELKKLVPNAEARKAELAEVEKLRARSKELEEHIKFVDYQASDEYKQKYDKPYEQQWKTAMRELKGVTVESADGTGGRLIEAQDLLELVNLPLAKARQAANEVFGEFADDVMQHRGEIRKLFDARSEALDKARKEGSEMATAMQTKAQEKFEAINGEVKTVYDKAVETFAADPKMAEFFKPIDGDDDANVMLEKGYAMVDRAFKENPMDPNLTAEQRASIVKRHAAVRHRSAAFGRVRHLLAKERSAHEATRKKLAQYESTVPNRGGSEAPAAPQSSGNRMSAMIARLRARSKTS